MAVTYQVNFKYKSSCKYAQYIIMQKTQMNKLYSSVICTITAVFDVIAFSYTADE